MALAVVASCCCSLDYNCIVVGIVVAVVALVDYCTVVAMVVVAAVVAMVASQVWRNSFPILDGFWSA